MPQSKRLESAPKAKPGRPAIKGQPTVEQQVQAMSQYGVPHEDIAAVIGISVETMQKLYGAALKKGKGLANASVGQRLFEKCEKGDTTALIFWAKTQMGWKETQKVEHSGADVQIYRIPDNGRS